MNQEHAPLSVGASIVLYRTAIAKIEPLLSQLLEQGVERLYVIDNSPLEFDTFGDWHPPPRVVTVRTGKNLGYGTGHNLAIRDSILRHDFHLICNPDIALGVGVLGELARLLSGRGDVGLAMPRVVSDDGTVQHLCKRAPVPLDILVRSFFPRTWFPRRRGWYEMHDQSYDASFEAECLSGCFMFFRTSVLKSLGGFDERYFLYLEDFDISRRAARHGRNLYWPHVQVTHGHQRGHGISLRLRLVALVSAVRYFNKWGWFERSWRLPARRVE